MATEWQELVKLTQGKPVVVERVRMADSEVSISGSFELPALARLAPEDQVFIMAFVRCHGSIKEMEKMFGVSYPTVKNRLNSIAADFEFVETMPFSVREETISLLERGEITADEAIRRLSS